MNKKFYYLYSLVFVFIIPTIFVGFFVAQEISIVDIVSFVLLIMFIGSIWDIWATRHGTKDTVWLWQFNHKETLGISFLSLPLEEYLFYIASSTYTVFLWEGIKMADIAQNKALVAVIPLAGLWTLLSVLIPYKLNSKGDTLLD